VPSVLLSLEPTPASYPVKYSAQLEALLEQARGASQTSP
jgi:hypothetical protein